MRGLSGGARRGEEVVAKLGVGEAEVTVKLDVSEAGFALIGIVAVAVGRVGGSESGPVISLAAGCGRLEEGDDERKTTLDRSPDS